MNLRATAANLAWLAASAPAYRNFRAALADPEAAQRRWLARHLARQATSAYARGVGLDRGASYEEFSRRTPVVGYDALAPWIARIRGGETHLLTTEPVARLLPTSGSTGARKLIPFTAGLQREFNAAIGPWLVDLCARHATVPLGPAYWSVTPMGAEPDTEPSAVPIGFEDDSRYLGAARAWLIESALAVPSAVRHLHDLAIFRRTVLGHLLAQRDLRFISVWHPSFLLLLLDTLAAEWPALVAALPPQVGRARRRELARADPHVPKTLWPHLTVVSAWADALAAGPAAELQRRLPGVALQAKGLLATEAVITIPFGGSHPAATTSHLLEFRDRAGTIRPVWDVAVGETYEVIVTTGGGLWRYALGDQVAVTGRQQRTPTLRFTGRTGHSVDLCGEKLAEPFVVAVLQRLAPAAPFALLAPEPCGSRWRYVLFIESAAAADPPADLLDTQLQENPQYALARRLGQLEPVGVVALPPGTYARFAGAEVARGRRLGDLKPAALSGRTDWREVLTC